jgi:hypothetical protein
MARLRKLRAPRESLPSTHICDFLSKESMSSSPLFPRVRFNLSAGGGGHKRNGVVNGSISQTETRCCLSPVDSSHPTCTKKQNTSAISKHLNIFHVCTGYPERDTCLPLYNPGAAMAPSFPSCISIHQNPFGIPCTVHAQGNINRMIKVAVFTTDWMHTLRERQSDFGHLMGSRSPIPVIVPMYLQL